MGIAGFGVSVTTMEEVFLKVKDESDEDVESRVQRKGSLRPNRDAPPVEPHQDTPPPAPGVCSLPLRSDLPCLQLYLNKSTLYVEMVEKPPLVARAPS